MMIMTMTIMIAVITIWLLCNSIVVIMLCLNHIMRFIRIMIWIRHCGWLRDVTSMITMINWAWTCKELWYCNMYIYILIDWNYPVVGGRFGAMAIHIYSPFKKQAAVVGAIKSFPCWWNISSSGGPMWRLFCFTAHGCNIVLWQHVTVTHGFQGQH